MSSRSGMPDWRINNVESRIQMLFRPESIPTPSHMEDNLGDATAASADIWLNPHAVERVMSLSFQSQLSPIDGETQVEASKDALGDTCIASFETASIGSGTFYSTQEVFSVASDESIRINPRVRLTVDNEHLARARRMGLLKPQTQELDWSGIGQHAQFTKESEVPLQSLYDIARSAQAIVDAVQCRRIRLARKRILCHRRFPPEKALEEVRHIQLFPHRHIVQCIGTYSLGKWIGILTYPVTRCNLEEFLLETATLHEYDEVAMYNRQVLVKSFACLASAIEYIHSEGVKHMDIKPQNILVDMKGSGTRDIRMIDIYLTDFGISRKIQDSNKSKTDGATGWTEMYRSPEVAKYEARGRSSDIFSLGCVFAEMATVVAGRTLDEFCCFRSDEGCAFYLNLPLVHMWIMTLKNATIYWDNRWNSAIRDTIIKMLSEEPDGRPSASDLKLLLGTNACCGQRQAPLKKSP